MKITTTYEPRATDRLRRNFLVEDLVDWALTLRAEVGDDAQVKMTGDFAVTVVRDDDGNYE